MIEPASAAARFRSLQTQWRLPHEVADSAAPLLISSLRRRRWLFPRLLSSPLRVLPDFVIFGAQRAGTTSLYNQLTQHPYVAPAAIKEIHYFDDTFALTPYWYRAHFPLLIEKARFRRARGRPFVTGEASPYYICYPWAPERIARVLPRVKLITILRNPIDRAYSQYQMQVSRGLEPLCFEEAIEQESARLHGEEEKIRANGRYVSRAHKQQSYLTRGIYVDQLLRWMSVFPSEQVLILGSEDFQHDPGATIKHVSRFLDIPEWAPMSAEKYHVQAYPTMSSTTRQRLVEYFQPHNRRLFQALNVNFDWDK